MNNHFLSLIDRLTLDDINVLNTLTMKESLNRYSARTKKEVLDESKITESKLRKAICRLEAMNFIQVVAGNREHLLCVTDFGQEAISNIYERGNG